MNKSYKFNLNREYFYNRSPTHTHNFFHGGEVFALNREYSQNGQRGASIYLKLRIFSQQARPFQNWILRQLFQHAQQRIFSKQDFFNMRNQYQRYTKNILKTGKRGGIYFKQKIFSKRVNNRLFKIKYDDNFFDECNQYPPPPPRS